MDRPFCPFLTAGIIPTHGHMPAEKYLIRCRGSACACWDPLPNVAWVGRCGIAKGFNFPDCHKPPAEPEEG